MLTLAQLISLLQSYYNLYTSQQSIYAIKICYIKKHIAIYLYTIRFVIKTKLIYHNNLKLKQVHCLHSYGTGIVYINSII